MKKRLAIIGAGPIGLEAAVAAEADYDVQVYERGAIAASVRQWGDVRMFSPFGMNSSEAGRARLAHASLPVTALDTLLTGAEYVDRYLAPLATQLEARVSTAVEVVAITRAATGKMQHIGRPERSATPLRLLLRRGTDEWFEEADLVFDCSGTFLTPNPLGDGGIPALGEKRASDRIVYGIPSPDGLGADARVLVAGGGHSAATAVRDLARTGHCSQVTWVTRRTATAPCQRIPDDPLMERDRLAMEANALARELDFKPGTVVHAIRQNGDGLAVTLARGPKQEIVHVDAIIAATGFRPDLALARELQTQTCWATEGSYKLAAALLGETGGDCLAVPAFGAETLVHPEPGYFTLGMKSYGRAPDFLIRTGIAQVAAVLAWLRGESAHRR